MVVTLPTDADWRAQSKPGKEIAAMEGSAIGGLQADTVPANPRRRVDFR
jgi:hypothetical protein